MCLAYVQVQNCNLQVHQGIMLLIVRFAKRVDNMLDFYGSYKL